MGCDTGDRVRTTIGERGVALSVWTWGALVGVMEVVGMGSMMQGIEVRGCVLVGGDVYIVDGYTLDYGVGYGRAMVSLQCPNRLWRSVIASSWVLQVTADASVIEYVSIYMTWMMQSSGVIEGCVS